MTEDEKAERLRRLAERRAGGPRPPEPAAASTVVTRTPSAPARRPHPAAAARVVVAGVGVSLMTGLVGWMSGHDAANASAPTAEPAPGTIVVVMRRSATPGAEAATSSEGLSSSPVAVQPQTVTVNSAPAPVRTHGSR